jgi:nitrogen fixation protein FixH
MGPINGRHVLFGFLVFFGIMFAVNGVFVYVATTTFSGISTDDAYRRGLRYNDAIFANKAIQASGWTHVTSLEGSRAVVAVQHADGAPVSGLALHGRVGRPATDAQDLEITFRSDGDGRYVAETGGLASGQWQLVVTVQPGANAKIPPYELAARLWSNP